MYVVRATGYGDGEGGQAGWFCGFCKRRQRPASTMSRQQIVQPATMPITMPTMAPADSDDDGEVEESAMPPPAVEEDDEEEEGEVGSRTGGIELLLLLALDGLLETEPVLTAGRDEDEGDDEASNGVLVREAGEEEEEVTVGLLAVEELGTAAADDEAVDGGPAGLPPLLPLLLLALPLFALPLLDLMLSALLLLALLGRSAVLLLLLLLLLLLVTLLVGFAVLPADDAAPLLPLLPALVTPDMLVLGLADRLLLLLLLLVLALILLLV